MNSSSVNRSGVREGALQPREGIIPEQICTLQPMECAYNGASEYSLKEGPTPE